MKPTRKRLKKKVDLLLLSDYSFFNPSAGDLLFISQIRDGNGINNAMV